VRWFVCFPTLNKSAVAFLGCSSGDRFYCLRKSKCLEYGLGNYGPGGRFGPKVLLIRPAKSLWKFRVIFFNLYQLFSKSLKHCINVFFHKNVRILFQMILQEWIFFQQISSNTLFWYSVRQNACNPQSGPSAIDFVIPSVVSFIYRTQFERMEDKEYVKQMLKRMKPGLKLLRLSLKTHAAFALNLWKLGYPSCRNALSKW
jgi:hypothetical protein